MGFTNMWETLVIPNDAWQVVIKGEKGLRNLQGCDLSDKAVKATFTDM